MVEILTLWSPHKLLQNLGALSEYAQWGQSSTKIKKKLNPYSLSWIRWNGKQKHLVTVPLNAQVLSQLKTQSHLSMSVNIHQLSCFDLCHALFLTMKGTLISNSYGCRLSAKKVYTWIHWDRMYTKGPSCSSPYLTRNQFQGIDAAYVAWRTAKSKRAVVPAHQAGNRFLGSLKGLQMRPQILGWF